ncbi:MAG TPA: hypothetical protein VEX13_03515, partial [Chloroflexia bacterium]|nr:hypothetical protein [Chloroflexia bacterium]
MSQNNEKDRTALYGCLGTVGAAIISGIFLLISSGTVSMDAGIFRIGRGSSTQPTAITQGQGSTPSPASDTPTEATAVVEAPTQGANTQPAGTLVVGQVREQDGISLAVTRIEIMDGNSGSFAASVSFRLLNKTGKRLLATLDWDKVHLEDSLGNLYMEWQGQDTESVTLEPQTSKGFQKYYSSAQDEESKIPASAEFVDVVVEELSHVTDARWRFNINAPLVPMPTPEPASVKAAGESWEEDGLELTVSEIEVTAGNGPSYAAHASFELKNTSNRRRLVEIDTNYIYMLDSFGQRYGNWQSGDIMTQWIEPGKAWKFDGYYSLMVGEQSTIPSDADYVLVKVEQL